MRKGKTNFSLECIRLCSAFTHARLSDSSRKIIPLCHTSCNNNHSKHRYKDDSLYICDRHTLSNEKKERNVYIYICIHELLVSQRSQEYCR
jgi:hypothetical protein